jgi:hypothetical protein
MIGVKLVVSSRQGEHTSFIEKVPCALIVPVKCTMHDLKLVHLI